MTGREGEKAAAAYLTKHGFIVVARNARFSVGEIDIIAKREEELHFFEVKTRGEGSFADPVESLSLTQQKRLRRAAECYLLQEERSGKKLPPCSFGLIAIERRGNTLHIECLEDVF